MIGSIPVWQTFLTESLFVALMLLGLAACGGFAVSPFRSPRPFVILAAPLAGTLCLTVAIALLYVATGWRLAACAIVGGLACVSMSAITLVHERKRPILPPHGWVVGLALLTLISVMTAITDMATIRASGPALLYMDGTDHLGYAHLADWLTSHPVSEPPAWSADVPYQAYPNILFRIDPRSGSFFALAVVRLARGLPGPFVYDLGCALFLCAGVLGVAGAFARTPRSLILLLAGLTVCHWFDYSRLGYFGKVMAYPSALMLVGLFLSLEFVPPIATVCILALLACGTALMLSGFVTALFFATGTGGWLLLQWIGRRKNRLPPGEQSAGTFLAITCLLMGIAVATTGTLARPLPNGIPEYDIDWRYCMSRTLDLETQSYVLFRPKQDARLLKAALGLWVGLLGIAIYRRRTASVAILAGSLLLLIALRVGGQLMMTFQLMGFFYPLSLCGAAMLVDRSVTDGANPSTRSARVLRLIVTTMIVLYVSLRIPRFVRAVQVCASGPGTADWRFSMRDADDLDRAMGDGPVEVDVIEPHRAIFLLAQFGSHRALQWSPRAWDTVLHYTQWPCPVYSTPARLKLVWASAPADPALPVLFRTRQFKLLGRPVH